MNIYRKQVLEGFNDKIKNESSQLLDLSKSFEVGDSIKIEKDINKRLIQSVSYYDEKESFYHGFLLALLTNRADWVVKSNNETGNGRADITVMCEDKETGFNIAMKQIDDKDYTEILRASVCKKILAYGISSCKKIIR